MITDSVSVEETVSHTLEMSLCGENLNHTFDLFLFVVNNDLIIAASALPYMNISNYVSVYKDPHRFC